MSFKKEKKNEKIHRVAIYSTPTCSYCQMVKEYFKKNGIKYREYNVAVNERKRKEMKALSGQTGVPVITIDNKLLIGYNEEELNVIFGL